jgi:MerR family transcriptional regulator/heat shock protein HspR
MQESPSSEPVYVISVAARLAELPCWVLRVLDQEGIVVPVRTDTNRRLYSDRDIAILARVRHLTEVRGVNIAGVKVILEMEQGLSTTTTSVSPEVVGTSEVSAPSNSDVKQPSSPSLLPAYSPINNTNSASNGGNGHEGNGVPHETIRNR